MSCVARVFTAILTFQHSPLMLSQLATQFSYPRRERWFTEGVNRPHAQLSFNKIIIVGQAGGGGGHTRPSTQVEVRGQRGGVDSFLPSACGFWGTNLGSQLNHAAGVFIG